MSDTVLSADLLPMQENQSKWANHYNNHQNNRKKSPFDFFYEFVAEKISKELRYVKNDSVDVKIKPKFIYQHRRRVV